MKAINPDSAALSQVGVNCWSSSAHCPNPWSDFICSALPKAMTPCSAERDAFVEAGRSASLLLPSALLEQFCALCRCREVTAGEMGPIGCMHGDAAVGTGLPCCFCTCSSHNASSAWWCLGILRDSKIVSM